MDANGIAIRFYEPKDQQWFESLNRSWIEEHFQMEPVDVLVLTNPEEYILEKGGAILMAEVEGQIVGTVALKSVTMHTFELTKMAVAEKFRGRGIGMELAKAALNTAWEMPAKKIILYSSTRLQAALELYRKIGFKEVPVDGPYKRSDIKMELDINAHEKT